MDAKCKAARMALRTATRSQYEALIHESKLTPFQEELVRRHILECESISCIASEKYSSEQRIKRQLHKAYVAVSLLLPFA